MMDKSRSLLIVFTAYLTAVAMGYLTGEWLQQRGLAFLWALAGADLVCTLIVFAFSFFFRNTSIYDPYWSVLPPLMAVYALESYDLRSLTVLGLTTVWAVRLTWNWIRRWKGMNDIDWRYREYEKRTGKWFWVVSFIGLQLVPTVVVFLACLPLFASIKFAREEFGILGFLGALLALFAVWMEYKSDNQLWAFLKNNSKTNAIQGLWTVWRFPNYVGEVLFWWGLFFIGIEANPSLWWILAGPLCMTALFHFISMPLMEERHRQKRPQYYRELLNRPRWIPVLRSSVKNKG